MDTARKTHHRTDVLICGSGSAGLTAALWLATYPGVAFRVLERRGGPLVAGQADGVQCRTVEILESFGLADRLLREAYHALELAFWAPSPDVPLRGGGEGGSGRSGAEDEEDEEEEGRDGKEENGVGGGWGIKRSHYAPDTEPGLSHQPHVILNQARINEMITEEMLRRGGPEIDYGYEVTDVKVDSQKADDPDAYPVTVTAVRDGVEEIFQAKYALVSLTPPPHWTWTSRAYRLA